MRLDFLVLGRSTRCVVTLYGCARLWYNYRFPIYDYGDRDGIEEFLRPILAGFLAESDSDELRSAFFGKYSESNLCFVSGRERNAFCTADTRNGKCTRRNEFAV